MDKFSYALGLGIGQNLLSMGLSELNTEDFVQAINDVIKGNDLVISHKEAQAIVTDYFNVLEERATLIVFPVEMVSGQRSSLMRA